jgi:iduronate 2-sulfatase
MSRFVVVLLACLCLVLGNAAVSAAPQYNVLFFMSDDLRTELGCYGHPAVKSPHIDALAKAGVRFDRAYVQYPLCNPSRSSMLNGRYPTTTGVLDNQAWFGGLHPEFVSLPKYFKGHGYAALRCGKIFHGGIDDADAWTEGGEPRKFEGSRSPQTARPDRKLTSDRINVLEGNGEEHADYKTADKAIDYLQRYKDKPFLLCCGFTKPHSPPTAPKNCFDRYDVKDVTLPPDFAATAAAPPGFPKASITPSSDLFMDREATPEQAKEMIRAYWASLTFADDNVGRVMAELDRQGLREKTIIVFWGDHGYHLGEKGKWSKHGSLYEVGTRVPLIVVAPQAKGNGKVCTSPVESIDIYPTLAELCGLPVATGLDGSSFASLLQDPSRKWGKPAISVAGGGSNRPVAVAVRTDTLRYASFLGENGGEMLFDETKDPHELKNLADDPQYASEKARLAEIVKQFRASSKNPGATK